MIFPENIKVFGDTTYRDKQCPKEDAELITFFNELRRRSPTLSAIALHIKNEGKRTAEQAARERAKGALKTGATDIVLMGFICELKRVDHTLSRLEQPQARYLTAAQECGGFACIALGYMAAFEALEAWLDTLPAAARARIQYTKDLF